MAASFEYLVVGGGNASGYAVKEFIAQGVGPGKIGIVTAEPVAPYERPALTKAYLHPPTAKVRARLPGFHTCVGGGGERQTPEWYAEKGVTFIQGKATGLNLGSKTVQLESGSAKYEKLIIATGTRALRVSQFGVKGDDLPGVFYLREEADAAALVKALEALNGAGKAVIVGGGYIGLEVAAALVGWGIDTTMVFPEAHVMSRLFNPELAEWLEAQYTARGIKILKGDLATEFTGADGKLAGVTLRSGATLQSNVVVVGVGAIPNTEFASALKQEKGGIIVDGSFQTSDPSVYAVGDIAVFPSQYGGAARMEHVDNARKSAAQAVKAALGQAPEPYKYLPYFYSRIFEYTDAPIVFNFFGDQSGEVRVCNRTEKSIAAAWVKDGKVVGALLMGTPGPTAEDQAKLKELVMAQPEATDLGAVFKQVSL